MCLSHVLLMLGRAPPTAELASAIASHLLHALNLFTAWRPKQRANSALAFCGFKRVVVQAQALPACCHCRGSVGFDVGTCLALPLQCTRPPQCLKFGLSPAGVIPEYPKVNDCQNGRARPWRELNMPFLSLPTLTGVGVDFWIPVGAAELKNYCGVVRKFGAFFVPRPFAQPEKRTGSTSSMCGTVSAAKPTNKSCISRVSSGAPAENHQPQATPASVANMGHSAMSIRWRSVPASQ